MGRPRFASGGLGAGIVELDARQSRHARVLRLERGELIVLFDGRGTECDAEIVESGRVVRARILGKRVARREPGISVLAATAVPKGRRLEFMVQKLAELGAEAWTPVVFARSVAQLTEARRRRLEDVSRESSVQCGRPTFLRIEAETRLEDLKTSTPLFFGDPDARDGLPKAMDGQTPVRAGFVVGPEGGLTREEEKRLLARGARPVRLAATILRVETAAIAFMAGFAGMG